MTNNLYPKKLNEEIVRELKPDDLGCVEVELQDSPLRNQNWLYRNGDSLSNQVVLNEWIALRGWVCQRLEEPDHEGPDHHIIIAYQLKGELYQEYFKFGYDSYHWTMSASEHCSWFNRTLNPKHSLTLLVNPKDHGEVLIFGQFEAFVREHGRLKWCAK